MSEEFKVIEPKIDVRPTGVPKITKEDLTEFFENASEISTEFALKKLEGLSLDDLNKDENWVHKQYILSRIKNKLTPEESQIKFLLGQEKPEFKSLGQGIHVNPETNKEFFYFGTKIYNGNKGFDAIVTSEGKIYADLGEDNQIRKLGINYRYPFFDSILDYTWSNKATDYSIMNFCFGKKKQVTLKECYEDTLNNEIELMDFQDSMTYVSKSCDITSSYFTPIFEAKGRTFDNADKGSGKTRNATIYDLQMFNPLMSADITGSSYFRAVESTNCSIIIDDFDAIPEEKRLPIVQLLRTGYKKGQKAVRTSEGKSRLPEAFNIFNSMVINNVGGLDEITQDRCNTYQLIKSTNKKKINKKLDVKDPKWLIQRDKKYTCALQNWELVRETYQNLSIEGINGRDLERIAPILTIGKIVLDQYEFEKLVEYEKNKIETHKDRDVSSDWLFMALKNLVEILGSKTEQEKQEGLWIRLDELVSSIMTTYFDKDSKDYDKTKKSISIYLGKVFKNTPLFKSGKVHGGFVRYYFEADKLLKFLEIKDYINYFNDNEISRIQSIQSNQPNQPNQSIQSNQLNKISKDNEISTGTDRLDSMDRSKSGVTELNEKVNEDNNLKGGQKNG